MTEIDEAAQPPVDTSIAKPTPILCGRFAVYETPDGGYHLSYRPDGAEGDEHVQIPGMYVKMLKGGGPLRSIRKLMGGRGGLV